MSQFRPDHTPTVRAGRAYLRLIEAAAVLMVLDEHDENRLELERVRHRYKDALRQLVEALPAHVTARITASDAAAHGFRANCFGRLVSAAPTAVRLSFLGVSRRRAVILPKQRWR